MAQLRADVFQHGSGPIKACGGPSRQHRIRAICPPPAALSDEEGERAFPLYLGALIHTVSPFDDFKFHGKITPTKLSSANKRAKQYLPASQVSQGRQHTQDRQWQVAAKPGDANPLISGESMKTLFQTSLSIICPMRHLKGS